MSDDDLVQELIGFEGSEALANGDFSVCYRGAAKINLLRTACSEAERTAIQVAECHLREMRRADALQKRVTELEGKIGDYYEGLEEGIKIGMEQAAKIAHEIAERGHITFNIAAGIRAKIAESPIMSSMSTKPMENMK